MTRAPVSDWYEYNQRCLSAGLAAIRAQLEGVSHGRSETLPLVDSSPAGEDAHTFGPTALDSLSAAFGLSSFERAVLLLCAGMELDARFAPLCAALKPEKNRAYPTFSLALAIFPDAHWSALAPSGPLRFWQLVEAGTAGTLVDSPLRIDERILNYLTDVTHLDERLAGLVTSGSPPDQLVVSHEAVVGQIVRTWSRVGNDRRLPVIRLSGADSRTLSEIAAAACAALELQLNLLPVSMLPSNPAEQETLIRLWEREAILESRALLLDLEDGDAVDTGNLQAVARWVEKLNSPLFVAGHTARQFAHRAVTGFEVHKPTSAEQVQLWSAALGRQATSVNGFVGHLVAQFSLDANSIREIVGSVRAESGAGRGLDERLWEACCAHTRPRLGELAQRIEPVSRWEDLVLPTDGVRILREIAVHVRQRMTVYQDWGFASRSARGLGISALFSGVSGTGKTMASEVLANELKLDLYRIDLSQVVSKYIGETEKNLRRVFDAADEGGAILLFDEADALFGKRSEVKDSHDRYANVEISYLLQRMEAYQGLAILTTNMREALDPAFMRRIRFIIEFPFPDAVQREEIWRRIFPEKTPVSDLAPAKLARLGITGGNIRNIALYSAFLAAETGEPVQMAHLLRAAQVEYAKLEKPLSAAEIGDWL